MELIVCIAEMTFNSSVTIKSSFHILKFVICLMNLYLEKHTTRKQKRTKSPILLTLWAPNFGVELPTKTLRISNSGDIWWMQTPKVTRNTHVDPKWHDIHVYLVCIARGDTRVWKVAWGLNYCNSRRRWGFRWSVAWPHPKILGSQCKQNYVSIHERRT